MNGKSELCCYIILFRMCKSVINKYICNLCVVGLMNTVLLKGNVE